MYSRNTFPKEINMDEISISSMSEASVRIPDPFFTQVVDRLRIPALRVIFVWLFLSGIIILIELNSHTNKDVLMLIGSLASIIGASFVFFSAFMLDQLERQVNHSVHFLKK